MTEMVERVARQMGDAADAYAAGEGCDEVGILDPDLLLELAAVAIAAMREPTEAMTNAAVNTDAMRDVNNAISVAAVHGEPTHEAHAREILGLPPEWQAYLWEVKGIGIYIEGAVPNGVFKRGKRKGHTNWKLRDKNTEAAITIPNDRHREWLRRWETDTGKCHHCKGTGQEFAGWSVSEGVKRRDCGRCGATGDAQPDKLIRY